jgi:ABC-type thiamine transport system ATPase subunit
MRGDLTSILTGTTAAGVIQTVALARMIVREEPGISGEELLARLELKEREAAELIEQLEEEMRPERTTCAKCGQPIETSKASGNQWIHSSDGSRGCRAATFTADQGWDDSIPRNWTATPAKAGLPK